MRLAARSEPILTSNSVVIVAMSVISNSIRFSIHCLVRGFFVALLFAGHISAASNTAGKQGDARKLSKNQGEQHSIIGGESHFYGFDALIGHYMRIDVGRSTALITISITGPDQVPVMYFNCRRCDSSSFSFIATSTGSHLLTVVSTEASGAKGRYDISIAEDRPAIRADSRRLAAERSFTDGAALSDKSEEGATRRALIKYTTALMHWRSAADPLGQARALRALGSGHRALGHLRIAQVCFKQAISLSRSDPRLCAAATAGLSQTYFLKAQVDDALAQGESALQLSTAIGDKASQAQALLCVGDAYNDKGDRVHARVSFERALGASKEAEDPVGEALALLNLGYASNDLGLEGIARGLFLEVTARSLLLRDSTLEASALAALGQLASKRGDKQEAIGLFKQALRIVEPASEPAREAPINAGLAYAYEGVGEPSAALQTYLKTLALWRAAGYKRGQAEVLALIAQLHRQTGDLRKARECTLQAHRILKNTKDPVQQSFVAIQQAAIDAALGNREQAAAAYSNALAASPQCGSWPTELEALNGLGDEAYARGDAIEAVDHYEAALRITKDHDDAFSEITLVKLGRVECDRGNLTTAHSLLGEALTRIETL